MKRIFITGMSGTGKSSVIEALRARGFIAIDTDYDNWSATLMIDGVSEWAWREERMQELLANTPTSPIFVAGCCVNQGNFYRFFDYKILLSAPLEVILERVIHRTSNPYGQSEKDRADIRQSFNNIQPLLKKSADIEIDTTQKSVHEITGFLIELASK